MQLLVVSTKQGRILSISRLGDVGEMVSGIGRAGVVVGRGQQLHEIDVPDDFLQRPLLELHASMRVNVARGKAVLVPIKRRPTKRETARPSARRPRAKRK